MVLLSSFGVAEPDLPQRLGLCKHVTSQTTMALFDIFLNAIGLARPLVPKALGPVQFAPSAQARFAALPGDWALHADAVATERGHVIQFVEGPAEGPPPPGYDYPLVAGNATLAHITGLVLNHDDKGWHLSVSMQFRPHETPNPNGRIYQTDRYLTIGRPLYFTDPEKSPHLAQMLLEIEHVSAVLFREHTVTVEREQACSWDPIDKAVALAVRSYFLGCGKALTGEAEEDLHSPIEREIMAVLRETILPAIHRDGGDLSLVGVKDGVVQVSLVGACASCPASELTLKSGIEKTLKARFPLTVERVESV